eukprot:scaffold5201_cov42-Cyclotella_meneghiniana.AAC.5
MSSSSSPPQPAAARSRPGRSSRRRKRKAQSILDAAASLIENEAVNNNSSSSTIPPDRGIILEGVKARRRQLRSSNGDASDEASDSDELNPSDEQQLTSQLGFVPGNVVCVAARLTSEFDTSVHPPAAAATIEQKQMNAPSVVKLYPMVVRDSYLGGKSDGRKFKGRRRGSMRTTATTDDNNNESHNSSTGNADERCIAGSNDIDTEVNMKCNSSNEKTSTSNECTKLSSEERCWFITSNKQDNKQQIIEPFPTLYWLTSPLLRSYISQIELSKTHGIHNMERRLKSSTVYLEQMERAHKSYGKSRWELLTDQDRAEVLKRGWGEALGVERGVAGIRPKKSKDNIGNEGVKLTWDGVKCLHAHAAHYLAQVEEWRAEQQHCVTIREANELAVMIRECNRDDLNLVGKWTMEAVLELVKKQT